MSPKAALIITLALVLGVPAATLLWTVKVKRAAAEASASHIETRTQLAHDALDSHLSDTRWGLERVALFVASDSRTRAAMTTESLDVTTISDALDEVQEVASVDLLALASVEGQVLASKGTLAASAPRGLTLKGDQLAQVREGRVTSTVWFQGEAGLIVSFAPVSVRDQLVGVAVAGRLLNRSALNAIAQHVDGVVGLFGPNGEWFGSAKLRDPATALSRASTGFSSLKLSAEVAAPKPPKLLWVPLVLLSALVLWAGGLALLYKNTDPTELPESPDQTP